MLSVLFPCLLAAAAGADLYISLRARHHSFEKTEDVPPCDFGLILGTSKYLADGTSINRYYQYRIDAAIELWRTGKVRAFVVSGSGVMHKPSETVCMQADLVAAGIPASAVWQDPGGLRTLDSIIRYRQKFGNLSACLISQPFHNQRALMQARHYRLNACAYNARIIGLKAGWKIHARERLARLRLWYDLACRTQPLYTLQQCDINQFPTEYGA